MSSEVDISPEKIYVVIIFSSRTKLGTCEDVKKVIEELGIITHLECISKTERHLYLSATTDTLLSLADEAELYKMTLTGSMQKFNKDNLKDFLLPGMTEQDLVRFCEAPVLIKDKIVSSISYYIRNNTIEHIFPLHDEYYLHEFISGKRRLRLPIESIRNYYGSSIGLYFGFFEFYTFSLISLAIFGLFHFKWEFNFDFVVGVCVLWTTIFLELWKRKCAVYSYRWGTIEMTSLDKPRPEYYGTIKEDPISKKLTVQYPIHRTYLKMYGISYSLVMICVFASIYFYYKQIEFESMFIEYVGINSWFAYLPMVLQSILILIFSWAYEKLVIFLTDWENHRTDSQYNRHMVNKLIIFEIVNNFFPLFYIAFYLQDINYLKNTHIWQMLLHQLGSMCVESGFPLLSVIRQVYRKYKNKHIIAKEKDNEDITLYEKCSYESGLDQYVSTYGDYLQLCIQFGYVVLFASINPLIAFIALFFNLISMPFDLFKLSKFHKRPFAQRVKNIGAWQSAFELISVLAILSNCGLLYLQSKNETMNDNLLFWRLFPTLPSLGIVLIFEHLLLGLKFILHKVIHEMPRDVRIALLKAKYEAYQAYKLLKKNP